MIFQNTRAACLRAGRRRQSGFTLVELLVVTAIVSLLAGMLMPALTKSMDMARRTCCANNLRQIGLAIQGYADSNNNWIVPDSIEPYTSPYNGRVFTLWPEFLGMGGYISMDSYDDYRPQGVFNCPAAPATENWVWRGSKYGLNSLLNRGWGGAYHPCRLGKVKLPSRTCLSGDTHSIENTVYWGTRFNSYYVYQRPNMIHSDGWNCLFIDLHTRWLPDTFPPGDSLALQHWNADQMPIWEPYPGHLY